MYNQQIKITTLWFKRWLHTEFISLRKHRHNAYIRLKGADQQLNGNFLKV